jgi:UDPglucose--hexose-1-phosphate uridylyltransferase
MAKFVPDVKTQRWIVISPARISRPDEHAPSTVPHVCPFCTGNESATPPEITRIGDGEKDKPGWKIRVIPNKYPITDTHEVIIHSPDHEKDIAQFEVNQVVLLFQVYKQRYLFHRENGHVMIFSNHGETAGASLRHAHSQLVIIPRQINLDALVREPVLNVVEDIENFVSYCPDFSQWPYEVWIAPKKEWETFGDVSDDALKDLAALFQKTIKRLVKKYEDQKGKGPQAYNYYIHHGKNWFIRIIPRLIHRAGFELGTGLSVNVVDPTVAAEELKSILT